MTDRLRTVSAGELLAELSEVFSIGGAAALASALASLVERGVIDRTTRNIIERRLAGKTGG